MTKSDVAAAGLSYSARAFSYYQNGNCLCHGGNELSPDWVGDDFYCDSSKRGGGASCPVGGPGETVGCTSSDACAALNCSGAWAFNIGHWYSHSEGSDIYGASSVGKPPRASS